MTTDDTIEVRLLGRPALLRRGDVIRFRSRKSEALCLWLAAAGGRALSRSTIADRLWGGVDRESARVSLRKCLSLLSADKDAAALLERDRSQVWFAGDPSRTDLAAFRRCLDGGTRRAYEEALRLWRGPPLDALEVGEPTFDEWVHQYRRETIAATLNLLHQRLERRQSSGQGERAVLIALCELIVHIEPTDAQANDTLVRLQGEEAGPAAAVRAFHAYSHALLDLDLRPDRRLEEYVASLRERSAAQTDAPLEGTAPPGAVLPSRSGSRAGVLVARPPEDRSPSDLFSAAHAELIHQMTHFRTLRTLERPGPDEGRRFTIGASVEGEDYRIIFSEEPKAGSVFLRCVNVKRQDTVSSARISFDAMREGRASALIAGAINNLESDVLSDHSPHDGTVFGRWAEAYRMMVRFDPEGHCKALAILNALQADERGRNLSLVPASLSSMQMVGCLLRPMPTHEIRTNLAQARDLALSAVAKDELEPFNHVILGWTQVQSGHFTRAIAAFDDAVALNPYSSRTLVAAALAHAYDGNHERARSLSERAITMSGRYIPRYQHGYYGAISYIVGDLDRCVDQIRRAPFNIEMALLRVAVEQERGDPVAAQDARTEFETELRRIGPATKTDRETLSAWICYANMERHPDAKRRYFRALEAAGLPVAS